MLRFEIVPYDVLFFGSGKPFSIGDNAISIFPPFSNTFASAICSKIYHQLNIDDISDILKAVYGPFFVKNNKLLLPKPSNIYSARKSKETKEVFIAELTDSKEFNLFNFNNTNKPEFIKQLYLYKGKEEVEPFNAFIYPQALNKWLNNSKEFNKDDFILYNEIFEYESRIGIKIDDSTNTVKEEDSLYRINFLRLKEDIKILFWVEFEEDNLKQKLNDKIQNQNVIDFLYNFFNEKPRVLRLGGEMKNIKYEIKKDKFSSYLTSKLKIKDNITVNKEETIEVLFLTNGVFEFNNNDEKSPINGFEIISACFDNYINMGIRSRNKGTKVKRAILPGSILSLKANENKQLTTISFIIKQKNNNFYSLISPKDINKVNWEFIGSNLVLIKKINN